MALTKFPVTLFYDILSPYSYLAFEVLTRYHKVWPKMDLKLKPCSIYHVFKETENKAPATVPKKASYAVHDLVRLAEMSQIPFVFPENFMELAFVRGSTKALRFLVATDIHTHSKATEDMSRQLWLRIFNSNPGKDISSPESFLEAGKLTKIDDQMLQKLISQVDDPTVKAKLIENTTEAVGFGAFGLPSMVIHSPEGPILLFGSDRIELLAHLIGEKYMGPNPLNKPAL